MDQKLTQHYLETKQILTDLANDIMRGSLKPDHRKSSFAPLYNVTSNISKSPELVDKANKRINEAIEIFGDSSEIDNYTENITEFLKELIVETALK